VLECDCNFLLVQKKSAYKTTAISRIGLVEIEILWESKVEALEDEGSEAGSIE